MDKKPVYIVDGRRTPFLKATGKPGPFSSADLAVHAGRALLASQNFSPSQLDHVVIGSAVSLPTETNIARIISMRLGCGEEVPAYTVQRNCASGLQAIDEGMGLIQRGQGSLILVGGTDAMSRGPILFSDEMSAWLGRWFRAKSIASRLGLLGQFRPRFFKPVIGLLAGLNDPIVNLSMGQTAENISHHFAISREQMDEFARTSHAHALAGQTAELFDEIVPMIDDKGRLYDKDDGVRAPEQLSKLSQLPAVFDKPFGNITAGNSSQVSDGAALLLLASEQAVARYQLPVLAEIKEVAWAGLSPSEMGLGPVVASTPLLQRHGLSFDGIDCVELNEAFAGQVLACLAAWQDEAYCQQTFPGMLQAFGELPTAKLNVDGGAIAIGHPIGATGARLVLHLCHVLKRTSEKRGLATLCIGGGQGGAALVEV